MSPFGYQGTLFFCKQSINTWHANPDTFMTPNHYGELRTGQGSHRTAYISYRILCRPTKTPAGYRQPTTLPINVYLRENFSRK